MAKFVDGVVVHATAGSGGNGCPRCTARSTSRSAARTAATAAGWLVVLVVDPGVHTLLDFHHRPHAAARNGKQGQGGFKAGANAADLELRVPDGTVVFDDRRRDRRRPGRVGHPVRGRGRWARRAGQRGAGHGGPQGPRLRAARRAGETRDLVLELRSMADVGLVGFPSAGKSSLVAALSAARPKIADYPFTTLVPQLGVVRAGEEIFTIADVPGLIPGASEGRGLGLDFLRHIERCSVLVHVVDCATAEPGRDPVSDIEALEAELARYTPALGGALADRPRLIALNKIDVPDAAELAELVTPDLADRFGWPVYLISTASRAGLRELSFALAERVREYRAGQPVAEPTRTVLRPAAVDDAGLHHRARPRAARRVPRARGPAGALDPADLVRQRRGRRVPGRPAGPARRRGGAGRGRGRARCPGDHRRRHLRLGAEHAGRGGGAAVRPRHRPPVGAGRPGRRGRPQGGPGRAPPATTPTRSCSPRSTRHPDRRCRPSGPLRRRVARATVRRTDR